MTYNRFLYNNALYNAGRDEVGAVARSLIQAHTGPHVKAVVGSKPPFDASPFGISFISDFEITEGTVTQPPAAFYFPDLAARIKATVQQTDDLGAFIRGFAFKDLPACIFIVSKIPNLGGFISALSEANLSAVILGLLAEKDLAATIFAAGKDLAGLINVENAPQLFAAVFSQSSPNLAAFINAGASLDAFLQAVNADDMGATVQTIQFKDLTGSMLGIPAPVLSSFIRVFQAGTDDLGGDVNEVSSDDLPAVIESSLDLKNLIALIRASTADSADLGATIAQAVEQADLQAIISFTPADNLTGTITSIPLGLKDRFFPASIRGVTPADLSATMLINANFKDLTASIQSLRQTADLGGFIRAAETFVTAILTVSTLSAANLRAVIGKPECAGGSASTNISATLETQFADDLSAFIESYALGNLGAVINNGSIFHAFDVIDVFYTSTPVRNVPTAFFATDTISVTYSPFRGKVLGASIVGELANTNLAASLTATFPLPRVLPSVTRITAADLRPDRPLNIQEVRLQLEGDLLGFFYVNGTDQAFIKDYNEKWKLNIRSFQPIAANLFGDFAAARICRIGDLTSFDTLDEAVRFCIDTVIGIIGEAELGALLVAVGSQTELQASISIIDVFDDLSAIANRVFISSLEASITAVP